MLCSLHIVGGLPSLPAYYNKWSDPSRDESPRRLWVCGFSRGGVYQDRPGRLCSYEVRGSGMSRTALQRASVDNPRRPALGQAGGLRPGVRRGWLTLPVVALIIVVAAAMAGAGTWYVVRKVSAARPPTVVPSSPLANSSGPAASGPASSGPTGPASAPPAGLASL